MGEVGSNYAIAMVFPDDLQSKGGPVGVVIDSNSSYRITIMLTDLQGRPIPVSTRIDEYYGRVKRLTEVCGRSFLPLFSSLPGTNQIPVRSSFVYTHKRRVHFRGDSAFARSKKKARSPK